MFNYGASLVSSPSGDETRASLTEPHINRTALCMLACLSALPISLAEEIWEAYMEKTGGGGREQSGRLQLFSSPENSSRTHWCAK